MSSQQFLPFSSPTLDEETIAGVVEVLRSGWITTGPKSKEFEAGLSDLFGGRHVVSFNSGTAALEVALRVLGIGPGDEVITTPMSWVATSNVILSVGARPVFVDVDPVTRNIDLEKIEAAITPATKALMPVDLAGLPVDRTRLYEIANQHHLRVVEDTAQAIGSRFNGKIIGSTGDLACFSFHPNKNITSIEGGCLVLNDEKEAALAVQYRLQGVVRSGVDEMDVSVLGGKFNLTDVAARVGLGQLPRLEEFNGRRREIAKAYFEAFEGMKIPGLELPLAEIDDSNWHMFQVVLPDDGPTRAEVMTSMKEQGIGTGVHYPAIHLFSLYRSLGWKDGDYPIAESIARRILSLPIFPTLDLEQIPRVAVALQQSLQKPRV